MDPDATQILNRTAEFPEFGDSTPEWETEVRSRLSGVVERFAGPLDELLDRDANEGDTRMLVADLLTEGLGFSKYGELTTEYRTKGESVDYGITLDGELFAFIEVKPCSTELDARNLRQAKLHAGEEGIAWVVLTNGRVWQVHHVGDGDDGTGLVVDVDLRAESPLHKRVDALLPLTREAVVRGRLDELRAWRAALEPEPLAHVLRSDPVASAIRAEVRRRTGHVGHLGDLDEVLGALTEGVIARRLQPEE
ncbi:hypothetical protein LP52_14355 [Streptomonospora alba]|uniref:Type I restriction enzyme R protein N-terminal domain-containing protein n=1 Tax=Streptomonospora alba TaxID=183763 RepID=A0A0C2JNA3_9ACTN|nr:hypothetical protein [Streptomonospora alba]KIH98322.1 hypothetical protein LP52_14355 [Streptomonospora alba]